MGIAHVHAGSRVIFPFRVQPHAYRFFLRKTGGNCLGKEIRPTHVRLYPRNLVGFIGKKPKPRYAAEGFHRYFFPLDDANPALYLMRQNLYPLADVVTVLSAENAAWWHSVGFHNVVQMPNFLTYGDDFEKRVPLAEPKGRFLCVGRICNRKNQCDVVSAFARYLKKGTVPESSRLMLLGRFESAKDEDDIRLLNLEQLKLKSKQLRKEMEKAVKDLDFDRATELRDQVIRIEQRIKEY